MAQKLTKVYGQGGGGGKGGGGGSTPVEAENSLRSVSTARIVDIISEGPTVGVIDGGQGVLLDNTPVVNSDDSVNFNGITVEERTGLPTQENITGFVAAETEYTVNTAITVINPVTRTIVDSAVDGVRIKIQVPALFSADASTGAINASEVQVIIAVSSNGGAYTDVRTVDIQGKNNAPYERSVRVDLPAGGAPWNVRLTRTTPDSEETNLQNATILSTYTELVDAKLSYPDTALVGITVNAAEFGTRIPQRTYHYRGLITSVPSNYDPETRTYTGIWDGQFKQAWHNNPAWVLYDLMTNKRYGLGSFVPETSVDKYGLYTIAQACDVMVPDGRGGMEPRYTFNGVIRSRQDAMRVLDGIASVFRGMIYWANGSVVFSHDHVQTPTMIVTPANVIDGEFTYSGSPLQSRSTSVAVAWNDPEDFGESTITVVQKDALVQLYGERKKSVSALGCTSRGQARRIAEWILYTEEHETETVSYRASLDHAQVRPGNVIEIADPFNAGIRMGGRVLSATLAGELVLDAPVYLNIVHTYELHVILPDGTLAAYPLTADDSTSATIDIGTAFPSAADVPIAGAMYIVSSSEVVPRQFRVITNTEKADNVFEITALEYDPNKFAVVERDSEVGENSYTVIESTITSRPDDPTNLSVIESFIIDAGSETKNSFIFSWTPSNDPAVTGYEVYYKEPNQASGFLQVVTDNNITIRATQRLDGVYRFFVRAVKTESVKSALVSVDYAASNGTIVDVPTNWTGTGGADYIELTGDPNTSPEFREFRIYGYQISDTSSTYLDSTTTTMYHRNVPSDDNYDGYTISAVLHNGLESMLTSPILVTPTPLALADLDGEVETAIDLAQTTADQGIIDAAAAAAAIIVVDDRVDSEVASLDAAIIAGDNLVFDEISSTREELISSNSNSNIYLYPTGTNGLGDWTDASLSADVPTIAESGEMSISISGNQACENVPRYGDINGRTFRFSGWIKAAGSWRPAFRGQKPGQTTNLNWILHTASPPLPATSGWEFITLETTITEQTNFWKPGIENDDHGTVQVLVWNLRLEDITDSADVRATLISDYRTAANSDIAIAAATSVVQANLDDVEADVTVNAAAIATNESYQAATYTIRARAGGAVSEVEFVAADDPISGPSSSVQFTADDILLNGTVTANKLNVGQGKNLLENSTYLAGLSNINKVGSGVLNTETTLLLRAPGETWSGSTYPVTELFQNGVSTDGGVSMYFRAYDPFANNTTNRAIPVSEGNYYIASIYASTHRCEGSVRLFWRDQFGTYISASTEFILLDVQGSSTNPDQWQRYFIKGQAPANAHYVQLIVRKYGTDSGTTSSLYVHKPMVEETTEFAEEPSTWSNAGSTQIDGDNILTGTVTAEKITVASLDAISATIGTFKTAATGERVEISDDSIKIYDASNVLRVSIGDLT